MAITKHAFSRPLPALSIASEKPKPVAFLTAKNGTRCLNDKFLFPRIFAVRIELGDVAEKLQRFKTNHKLPSVSACKIAHIPMPGSQRAIRLPSPKLLLF